MGERAVSEVIGFVLVFSLVVSTLGIVYVSGFSGLQDAREAERFNNAERAFDVLADNVADIYYEGAPSRKTEIKLADAQLTFEEATTFTVTVEDIEDAGGNDIVYEANTRPIVFSAGGSSELVYENGAIIRSDPGGSVLQRAPPMVIRQERMVVGYLIVAQSRGSPISVGGSSTVLVRMVRTGQSALVQDQSDAKVTLSIETATERATVWERYLNERADWSGADWSDADPATPPCETTDLGGGRSEVTCTIEPGEFYLTSTGLDSRFIS